VLDAAQSNFQGATPTFDRLRVPGGKDGFSSVLASPTGFVSSSNPVWLTQLWQPRCDPPERRWIHIG